MSVNLKPLGNNVVVKPIEGEERTALGIVLPETAKEKPQKAEVVAIGPGKRLDNGDREGMDVSVGDIVLFAKYGGTEVKVAADTLLILSQDSILAVFE